MCLRCSGLLNVLNVCVCVELNCELGGQFVSWAVYVSPDRPPSPLLTALDKDISWALLTLHAHL